MLTNSHEAAIETARVTKVRLGPQGKLSHCGHPNVVEHGECAAQGKESSSAYQQRPLFLVRMYRWFPSILKVVTIVQPETLVRWHRAGFRRYWRWKSNSQGGRPRIEIELRALIRQMSTENQLWGAPRIHGELLKLGFSVAQSTVAKYMVKRRGPPSQGWRTFCETTLRTLPPWICSRSRPLASNCCMAL
jgi:hypothetical protein